MTADLPLDTAERLAGTSRDAVIGAMADLAPKDWDGPREADRLRAVHGDRADRVLAVVAQLVADARAEGAAEATDRAASLLSDLALERHDGALEDLIISLWDDADKYRHAARRQDVLSHRGQHAIVDDLKHVREERLRDVGVYMAGWVDRDRCEPGADR